MNLQCINWKIFLDNPGDVKPDEFFKAFSAWIPDSAEVFVDVADYSHVHDGPVVILIGHYLNFSLDATDRKPGVLCDYKQPLEGGNGEKLLYTLLALLRAANRLQSDPLFSVPPRFRGGELELVINSRALAPNTSETWEAVKSDLAKVLAQAYGEGNFSLAYSPDSRRRFSVHVTAKAEGGVGEILRRLDAIPALSTIRGGEGVIET